LTLQEIIETSNTFVDFSHRLEDVHDNVHGWVGGTMSLIPTAAYDPVFWAHHTMIDRAWYLWQVAHPGATVPASILHGALRGFTLTVADTLDINHLGYEYVLKAAEETDDYGAHLTRRAGAATAVPKRWGGDAWRAATQTLCRQGAHRGSKCLER
jgi:hypothetical protein